MKKDTFASGVIVQYKEHVGYVDFICDEYFTVCIDDSSHLRLNHVCILVYKQDWNDVKLLKESTK